MTNVEVVLSTISEITGGQLPYGSITKIAGICGVTKSTVGEKAKEMKLIQYRQILEAGRSCINCGKVMLEKNSRKLCSPACRKESSLKKNWKSSKCKMCGKEFLHIKSRYRMYCSKLCQGMYLGKNYNLWKRIKHLL